MTSSAITAPAPTIVLRDYQNAGVQFLIGKDRAILGDEPGLGKTFVAYEAARMVAAAQTSVRENVSVFDAIGRGFVLVVCPTHLMDQWRREINTYAPDVFTRIVHRHEPDTDNEGVYIISYNSIQYEGRASLPWVWGTQWDVIIFDEAHRMKNFRSQRFKNAKLLRSHSQYFLTGTPMSKNPGDIWALLHMCDRKRFRSYWKFVEYWCEIDETPWSRTPEAVRPFLLDDFAELTNEFMLRRLKRDHLKELPPVQFDIRAVPIDKKLLAAYRRAKEEYILEHPNADETEYLMSGGALIQKLRVLLGNPGKDEYKNEKADYLRELIADLSDEQVIVFTWYRESAYALAQGGVLSGLPTDGLSSTATRNVYVITGDTPQGKRPDIVAAFRADPTGILIGTMATISEGMNLQTASNVVFYETHYVPDAIEQAVSRVQRLGQMANAITAYVLVYERTVDEKVWRVSQRRHKNITAALMEEILFLEDDE